MECIQIINVDGKYRIPFIEKYEDENKKSIFGESKEDIVVDPNELNEENIVEKEKKINEKTKKTKKELTEEPVEESIKIDEKDTQKEVYTHDFYPWWRTPRWWNYDGWLYNRPYYNYWRRPSYYNMWYSGNPIIIGGKRYYKTSY